MKLSDFLVSFFIDKGITDVFGFPGGMVIHLMDSFAKHKDSISAHVIYHEQGAAFAACGYAQTSLKPGVAYATSGPGATNLLTGICNAFYDSIPVFFITGQVNTYEGKGSLPLRQKGFQEMDVCSIVSSVTKYCAYVSDAKDIRYHLEKAYHFATSGRPGPVVLDIPMNIQREDVAPGSLRGFDPPGADDRHMPQQVSSGMIEALARSSRPCIIAGAGINSSGMRSQFAAWVGKIKAPVVSSMPAVDVLPGFPYYYGFIGAYGHRHANFILAKSDLVISLGTRLDLRQTGADTSRFAMSARLLRIDVDPAEFSRKVKQDEMSYLIDLKDLLPSLARQGTESIPDFSPWLSVCEEIKRKLEYLDEQESNIAIRLLSGFIGEDTVITTDVGQNQVWVAQSFIQRGQRVLFTGGHGSMGYSLPAAIGAHYGSGGKKVVAFCGDGGMQMNIQELQVLARERLPIKIILLNNRSLGMIRHFQEMYLESSYTQTKKETGYTVPDFGAVSGAYGVSYIKADISSGFDCVRPYLDSDGPALIEISLDDDTYVFPKLAMGKLSQDQEPELDRELFKYISDL